MGKTWKDFSDYTYLLHHVVNMVAMGQEYEKNWSDEYCLKEARRVLKEVQDEIEWEFLLELSNQELSYLGFGRWNDKLWLIPIYLWRCVPDGTVLTSINGETKVKGKDIIDLDVRYGRLAYGIIREE